MALPVLRSNLEWFKARFYERVGDEYVTYPPGPGIWSASDISQGCDCSALAAHVLNGVLYGPQMQWQRIDPATAPPTWITTESWRPIDYWQTGPFGTIDIPNNAFPSDAVVKIAIHHGVGGAGHMWVECDGVRMESNGTNGCVAGGAAPPDVLARSRGPARSVYENGYADDWAYLPGPIVDDIGGTTPVVSRPIVLPRGVDYSAGIPSGKALRDAGFGFACRYVADGGTDAPYKRLTPEEARDLQANGVQVVSNWESTRGRMLDGYQAGRADAAAADDWHRRCGGPPSRPIYFSADIEVTEQQQGAVNDYLRGCGDVLGAERVGLYGGYETCRRAWDAGVVRWLWQTETWSQGSVHPKIHILQRLPVSANQTYVNGVQCDTDETRQPDYGQWAGDGSVPLQQVDPNAWPLPDPPNVYWGPQQGPDNAWSNLDGSEPQYSHDGLIRWQSALGIRPSGVFDATTKAAAILCQQSHRWPVTGNVYKGEWDAVFGSEHWRLPAGVPLPTTGILRANIDYAIQIFTQRIGAPYTQTRTLDPNNASVGTDCSGLVFTELEALVYGVTNMNWTRRGNTESWPYDYTNHAAAAPGTKGLYGTVCAGAAPAGLAAIPHDAVAIIPIMHGGPHPDDSHMEIQVEGVLMESGGTHTNVPPGAPGSIGGAAQGATALNNPEWTDYWYLPGPIIENTLPGADDQTPATPTAPPDYLKLIYEQLLGPVGQDGYGHGWEKLGTNDQGQNLTLVDFLAKYKPALDALLEQCATTPPLDTTAKPTATTRTTLAAPQADADVPPTPRPKKVTPPRSNPRPRKAAPRKARSPKPSDPQ